MINIKSFKWLSRYIKFSDQLPGGKADNLKLDHFMKTDKEKEDLATGIKHEMEHTDDPNLAAEIAMDHEIEQKDKSGKYDYYENLEKSNVFLKQETAGKLGYIYELWVFDGKGNLEIK